MNDYRYYMHSDVFGMIFIHTMVCYPYLKGGSYFVECMALCFLVIGLLDCLSLKFFFYDNGQWVMNMTLSDQLTILTGVTFKNTRHDSFNQAASIINNGCCLSECIMAYIFKYHSRSILEFHFSPALRFVCQFYLPYQLHQQLNYHSVVLDIIGDIVSLLLIHVDIYCCCMNTNAL